MTERAGVDMHWQRFERAASGWVATCSCGWQGWAIEATRADSTFEFDIHRDAVSRGVATPQASLQSVRRRAGDDPPTLHRVPIGG